MKVDKFLFLVHFVVMDMDEDNEDPLILGRPFMKNSKVMIDVVAILFHCKIPILISFCLTFWLLST